MKIRVPISVGELADKITILEIKKIKIKNNNDLREITKELKMLKDICKAKNILTMKVKKEFQSLKKINLRLWSIEDKKRSHESKKIFDHKIRAAISVKKRLDLICENNNIWRLQTAVKEEFKTGKRFAEWLGLKSEGLMQMYGPDKTNYYRMAKIYECSR